MFESKLFSPTKQKGLWHASLHCNSDPKSKIYAHFSAPYVIASYSNLKSNPISKHFKKTEIVKGNTCELQQGKFFFVFLIKKKFKKKMNTKLTKNRNVCGI